MSSLMANFDIARDTLETSQNSAGSAMAEHAKWSESLEARLLKLKAAWQSLSQSFLKSDFLKGGLDAITSFVNGIDGLINKIGVIPTLLGGFALGKAGKGLLSFRKDIKSVSDAMHVLQGTFPALSKALTSILGILPKVKVAFMNAFLLSGGGGVGLFAGLISGLKAGLGALISMINPVTATIAALAAVVGGVVYFSNKQKKEIEELSNKVSEATTTYKEQRNELAKNKESFNSLAEQYSKLSRGVSSQGENISLTTDEYLEYQNVVNSIAEQVPSLVSGYDSQGNAILNCAGNVNELTSAYEDLIKAQNNELLKAGEDDIGLDDIEKDFKNKMKEFDGEGKNEIAYDSIQRLEKALNGKYSKNEVEELFNSSASVVDVVNALKEEGLAKDVHWYSGYDAYWDAIADAIKDDPKKVREIINDFKLNVENASDGMKEAAKAALSNAVDFKDSKYYDIGDTLKNVAGQVLDGLSSEDYQKILDSGMNIEEYVDSMLSSIQQLESVDVSKLEDAFNLATQFNSGNISYGEYVGSIKDVRVLINDLKNISPETKNAIKNALNIEDIIGQYEALSNFLQNDLKFDESGAEDFLNSLSAEEFAVLMDIKPEIDAGTTASEIQDMIDKEIALRGLTVKLDIEVEKAKIEALTTALSEMVSGAGMSFESISAVEGMFSGMRGYDPSKLFERTANGIRLNREELGKLNSEYSKTNLAELNKEMSSLGDIYNQTREELHKLAYGTDEYNAKAAELTGIESRINELEKLKSQYEGLASAYQQWQIAESTGNERDMYENVIAGIQTVKDELSRGWADDSTVEFLELLTGRTDLASKSGKELKEVWDGLSKTIEHTAEGGNKGYSILDFFTTDKDGNSTSKGVYNFLDAIGHMEEEVFGGKNVVDRKDGKIIGFNFDLVGGDKVIAEALGISEELVQIMVRAADDAGFVVSFDGTYQQLDVLREKAQLAAESMNKILKGDNKKTIEIDMNADSLEEIQPQIDQIMETFGQRDDSGKLTGSIDMSIDGAEDALTVVSTLQSMKDRLERPAYMEIQTSQVDDALKDALKNLQDYQTKIEKLNQAKLHGADTTELEASIEESKNKVLEGLKEIQKENPKLAMELDIDGDSEEQLLDKIETGKIIIPASIDVQLEMDEKLGILVDKALLDAGLLDPEEFNKRVEIYLDTEVDDNDAKEEINNAVNDATKDTKDKPNKPIVIEQDFDLKVGKVNTDDITQKDVKTGLDGRLNAIGVVETEADVKVNAGEVNTESLDNTVKAQIDADNKAKTGAKGRMAYSIGNVDVKADNVDTSDIENKTSEAVESQSGETTTLEKDVQLEFNINDYVDELSKFKDVAKELEGLEDIAVKINVNLEGELDSDKVSKLKEFAEGAKELSGASNKDISVKINFDANLSDDKGVENLAEFAKGAKELKGVESGEFSITANLGGTLANWTGDMSDLAMFAETAKNLQGLPKSTDVAVNPSIGGDITSESVANLKSFADAVNALPKSAVNISVKASVDTGSINNAITLLNQVSSSGLFKDYNANVTVTFQKESGEVDSYEPPEHTKTVTYNKDSSAVDGYDPPNLTRTVTYRIVTVGGAGAGGGGGIDVGGGHIRLAKANGTAHANGTAYAEGTVSGKAFKAGDWRTKESGVALMGELGRKLFATIHSDMY